MEFFAIPYFSETKRWCEGGYGGTGERAPKYPEKFLMVLLATYTTKLVYLPPPPHRTTGLGPYPVPPLYLYINEHAVVGFVQLFVSFRFHRKFERDFRFASR